MNINVGKMDFYYYEEDVSRYHNDVELIKHYDGNIKVTLNDIVANFGFQKKYLTETIDYPIERLPNNLKKELLIIYNKIKEHVKQDCNCL